jgi:hypothetical protein
MLHISTCLELRSHAAALSSQANDLMCCVHADGIDVCGQRLADEMKAIVARNPSLERISVSDFQQGLA